MDLKRALYALSAAAVAGTLLLSNGPTAHADASRNKQWALQAFKAQQRVWPLSTGKGVIVAVVDGPIRATHVDLEGQVLDGDSFTDDSLSPSTDTGHGTLVASLIAGHGHGPSHSEGIMGLAPNAKILPLVVDVGAADSSTQIGSAIRYAVDHGAAVVNVSLGGASRDVAQQSAVAYAEAHDVVIVAGTGNDGTQAIYYPAAFPGVISVGGANQDGSAWNGTNYGAGLDLVAPAVGILGDDSGNDSQYALGDGTSLATAYVSAAAALVRSKFPNLTAGQVINRLIKTAVDPNAKPGQTTPDPHYGYGILRPDAALNTVLAAGPAAGPLPQAVDPLADGPGGGGKGMSTVAATSDGASGGGGVGVGVLVGVGAAAVLGGGLAFVALSRRRRQSPSDYR